MTARILITGCSGGGKSTLLAELARRGYATVPEPGRRIIAAETDPASPRLPWNDAATFARAAQAMALADFAAAEGAAGPVFFDRGLIDAQLALAHATAAPADAALLSRHRYDAVFLAPPWPEIHVTDAARRHGLPAAIAEYHRIRDALPALGYDAIPLPRAPVAERAAFVLRHLPPPTTTPPRA